MVRNLILCVFLFGAFASLLTTGLSHPSAGRSEPPNGEAVSIVDRGGTPAGNYQSLGERIELERSWDGHFYADVDVNGQKINFLVDTGASVIALSREDARKAGLAASISMPEVVGQGASGDVHGEIVSLDRVALGSREAEDVPALVLDSGSQSLLGQSFLSKFSLVEIRGDTMILQ